MEQCLVEYNVEGEVFESVLIRDSTRKGQNKISPGVLLCPAFHGINDFVLSRARLLAEMGYVAMAVDVYGKGMRGSDRDSCRALMKPLVEDRAGKLRRRLTVAYEQLLSVDGVDKKKMAVIGYCFGGMCALDLARWKPSGLCVAVSFHGTLTPVPDVPLDSLDSAIQVFHGDVDPVIKPEHVTAFMDEMRQRKVDWHLTVYGNAGHAFTEPGIDKAGMPGVAYNAEADHRSWAAMLKLFDEKLGKCSK